MNRIPHQTRQRASAHPLGRRLRAQAWPSTAVTVVTTALAIGSAVHWLPVRYALFSLCLLALLWAERRRWRTPSGVLVRERNIASAVVAGLLPPPVAVGAALFALWVVLRESHYFGRRWREVGVMAAASVVAATFAPYSTAVAAVAATGTWWLLEATMPPARPRRSSETLGAAIRSRLRSARVEATIAALLALAASQVIALLWVIPLAPVLAVGLLLVFSVSTAGMTIDGLRNENVREATRFHSLAASVASCVGSRTGQDGDGPIRVAALSRVIAEHVEHGARWADAVEEAALLRNLGHLVLSPEGLDGSGRDQMQGRSRGRSHLPATCAVLRNVPLSTEVRDTIASLQERWDGWGHPRGLSGPAIPLGARILALAEAIDRILGEPELDTRGHKRALSTLSGKQLDPNLVEAIESKWADLRGARLSSQAFSSPSQTRSPSPLATALKRRLESESRMLRELRSLLSRSPIIDEFNLEAVAEIVRQRLPVRALGVVDLSRELDDPLIIATRQFDSNTLLRLAYTAPTQARRDEAFVRTDVPGEPAKLIIELDAPAPQREVERVTEVLARMLRPAIVARRTTEAVRNVAFIDPLTRLGNRRAFEERKAVFLGRARALGTPFALLVIDMDNLKPLNDRHGHAAGDAALRRLADVIRGLLREEDFAARLGGDEFAVFLDGCDAAGAELVAARLETDLSQTALVLDDASLHTLHLSVGAAIWPADGDALATLLTVADQRMYACKIARKQARI